MRAIVRIVVLRRFEEKPGDVGLVATCVFYFACGRADREFGVLHDSWQEGGKQEAAGWLVEDDTDRRIAWNLARLDDARVRDREREALWDVQGNPLTGSDFFRPEARVEHVK